MSADKGSYLVAILTKQAVHPVVSLPTYDDAQIFAKVLVQHGYSVTVKWDHPNSSGEDIYHPAK